jgi:citrate lyase subunit beta / citryl-CoA lyase
MPVRPRRSVLYLPASNDRALAKAAELPADALILDLEDAVAPDDKSTARSRLPLILAERRYGTREVVVRVNGLDTPWGEDDLRTLATVGADALLLPKIDGPDGIRAVAERLEQAGAPTGLALWSMLETPSGVLNAAAIAGHPRVQVLVMGNEDLAKALRVDASGERGGLLHAMSHCVLAARASGREILDGVYTTLNDEAGLQKVCEQGRALGFDGKTLIHPRQIDTANRVFGPSPETIEQARRIVDAWDRASGRGVIVVDGRMIERLHVTEARRLLALAAFL